MLVNLDNQTFTGSWGHILPCLLHYTFKTVLVHVSVTSSWGHKFLCKGGPPTKSQTLIPCKARNYDSTQSYLWVFFSKLSLLQKGRTDLWWCECNECLDAECQNKAKNVHMDYLANTLRICLIYALIEQFTCDLHGIIHVLVTRVVKFFSCNRIISAFYRERIKLVNGQVLDKIDYKLFL